MSQFAKARLKLTLWYVVMSLVMLTIFSVAAISAEINSFNKIEDALGDRLNRPVLTALLVKRLDNFESDFQERLLKIDLVLLIFATAASYFLSGKTLRPIEAMLKEQEEFAAEVSHELRTPLAVMGMELEALKRTRKKIDAPTLELINSNLEEIKRMGRIVDQLLILVRPSSDLILERFDLGDLVDEIAGTIRDYWSIDRKLKLKVVNNGRRVIYANKDLLRQILMILLDNAGKYTPNGGSVSLMIDGSRRTTKITVRDNGVGIPPDEVGRVFERFFRGSNISSKGSGLGLAIAKKLTERLGGSIGVVSRIGKGSDFVVSLPSGRLIG